MNELKITEIHFHPIHSKDNLIGFISIVINNSYLFSGIAVYTKADRSGYRITYPTKITEKMKYEYHHPITKETSIYFEEEITKEVKKQIDILKENNGK